MGAMVVEQVERAFEKTAKPDKASHLTEGKINEIKDHRIKKLEDKLIQ